MKLIPLGKLLKSSLLSKKSPNDNWIAGSYGKLTGVKLKILPCLDPNINKGFVWAVVNMNLKINLIFIKLNKFLLFSWKRLLILQYKLMYK